MRPAPRLLLALPVAAIAAAAAPASAAVHVSTKPSLRPGFSRSVTDYVIRCNPDRPIRVHVRASGGDRVRVGTKAWRGGEFTRRVRRATGERFALRVRSGGATKAHYVRCLPRDFPHWKVDRHGSAQAQWYVIDPLGKHPLGYLAIFDARGIPLWWWYSADWGPWDGKLLPDGTIAFARWWIDNFGVRDKDAYEVRRLDGSLVRLVRTVGNPIDTHDMQQLPNGDYLAITYRRRHHVDLSAYGAPSDADVFDGEIQELAPDGRLVWRWNSKSHIPLSWTGKDWWALERKTVPQEGPTENGYDLVHINSVEPDGDGLIVSSRHTNSVFRIDRATGKIDWKLGGTHAKGKSLKVLGAHPSPLLAGQHDARLWKDGSLTVHDNGSWHRRPGADRFEIDPVKRTARLVERVTNPGVDYETAIGSARKLAGGDWVVSWGPNPFVTEQTPGGRFVRRFHFLQNHWSSRGIPIEPGRLGASALRRGMDRLVRTHADPDAVGR